MVSVKVAGFFVWEVNDQDDTRAGVTVRVCEVQDGSAYLRLIDWFIEWDSIGQWVRLKDGEELICYCESSSSSSSSSCPVVPCDDDHVEVACCGSICVSKKLTASVVIRQNPADTLCGGATIPLTYIGSNTWRGSGTPDCEVCVPNTLNVELRCVAPSTWQVSLGCGASYNSICTNSCNECPCCPFDVTVRCTGVLPNLDCCGTTSDVFFDVEVTD